MQPSPIAFRLSPFHALAWSLCLFVAALCLNTRHHQFPYFYHPDEGVKVEQVRTGDWNYHHPMLLLTVTKAVVDGMRVSRDEQSIVEAGRWVSAGFMALAVVALSLLALAWRGWAAGIGAGLALLLHHQLFELAHYLKEDSALLCGMALTFLTVYLFARNPSALLAAALGAASACAISGKYIGLCVLAVVVPVLWRSPAAGRVRCSATFLAGFVTALVIINLPLILHPDAFARSFHRELELVAHGQQDIARRIPHTLYLNIFRDNTTPVMWVLLLFFLASRWRERAQLTLVEWLLIAFPFAFTLVLSFSPKTNDRYYLPASAIFTVFAAFGALDAAKFLGRWLPERCAAYGLLALLVMAQVPGWMRYDKAFQTDDNRDLLDFVRTQLPPSAVIVKDNRILLPDPDNERDAARFPPMPQKIIARRYAADLGDREALRKMGVTHIAISESDYGGLLLQGVRTKPAAAADSERRKAFYDRLVRDETPLFQRERSAVLYLHPGIRLYALPAS